MDFVGNPLQIIAEEKLLRPREDESVNGAIKGKDVGVENSRASIIGLYFTSAKCPNCSTFTRQLQASYEKIRKAHSLEIISVCLDEEGEDKSCENEVYPWLVLSPSAKRAKSQLCSWLCVRAVPCLILVDSETGRVVTRHARQRLLEDPEGFHFPWSNKSLTSVLAESGLTDAEGAARSLDEIQGRVKGLYFSANWCPPCKAFTPHLTQTWNQVENKKSGSFPVIFVSSDRSEESFQQYLGTMPWLAVPYDKEKRRKELADTYEVHGIPTLILLDEEDRVITREGRYEVIEDPEGKKFPWKPSLVEELTHRFSTQLNDAPMLVLFTDSGELELSKELLVPVAREVKDQSQADCTVMQFFVGGESELCDTVRELAHLEDEVPLLCILDTLREEKYVFEEDEEISTTIIRRFVSQFLSGDLLPQSFSS